MRRHPPFAHLAHTVALDRLGQYHRWRTLEIDRRLKCRIDLVRIVSAPANGANLLVGQLLRHLHQPFVDAKKMRALLRPARNAVLLVLPVY